MTGKIIHINESPVYYRVGGAGKTVVLVHGFGEDGEVWNEQAAVLEKQFRVIVPDIPGSGRSGLQENAGIDQYADTIKLLLDAERGANGGAVPGKFIMIGHSMGGYITLAFAEKHPGSLEAFGLFHSSAFADDEEKKQTRLKAVDFLQENGASAFLKTSTPGLFTKEFAQQSSQRIQALLEQGRGFTKEALIQYYHAMIARPDRTGVLRNFEGRVLFVLGEHDNAVPMNAGLRQCTIPAESHLHILHSSAHMGMWEETEKSNSILLNFISDKVSK
jgi:pimeloyl-ACP methyl ester carboxylesterase